MRIVKNYIIPFFLLWIFLAPSVVKVGHHHTHFTCNAKSEKHHHTFEEKCAVCNFEFSVYSIFKTDLVVAKTEFSDRYSIPPYKAYFSDNSKYSFLLRAPPIYTNSI